MDTDESAKKENEEETKEDKEKEEPENKEEDKKEDNKEGEVMDVDKSEVNIGLRFIFCFLTTSISGLSICLGYAVHSCIL